MRLRFSHPAGRDLAALLDMLAMSSPNTAETYRGAFQRAFEHLLAFPHSGRMQDALDGTPRRWNVWPYAILYKVAMDEVTIMRIADGRRDLKALWNDE